ncbi:hypothetical protein HZC21_06115 [Candidatus Peregrinibacteria bacterium]|nr:hypothetical protein [Candidatus Peregrinibacteria bacterium]
MGTKNCKNCRTAFEVTEDDFAFLYRVSPAFNGLKYSIPSPTHCPDCRQQRRLAQCNEQFLYLSQCGLCGKRTVTENPPHANQPIYCRDCWYSDKWNPRDYGKEFDFSRTFFEQFYELRGNVPAIALNQTGIIENSDYIHYAGYSKNCYLIAHADFCEDCCYGYGFKKNTSCMDGFYNLHCELCYDNVYIHKSYGLIGCQDCISCSNSAFLKDCIGCKNCFLCTGLRNCEYYFENKKLTKKEYEANMKNIDLGSYQQYQYYKGKLRAMEKNMMVKEYTCHNIENSTGNYLQNCKNCKACFDVEDGEDLKYCYQLVLGAKDSRDIYQYGTKINECYECSIVGDSSYHILFSSQIFINNADLLYCCFMANGCKYCFGCCNMTGKSYCIMNKQYTKEEYEGLVPRIIEHMKTTGEWGEFLPIQTSLFGYNKTSAQLYYPLSQEQVVEKQWKWDDYELSLPTVEKTITANQLPDNIKDAPDDIVNWALICEKTRRPFKIQLLELKLLRKMNVPIPRLHPDQRHRDRFSLRNPRRFWNRTCAKCQKNIMTTYGPEREKTVNCEKCYLEMTY